MRGFRRRTNPHVAALMRATAAGYGLNSGGIELPQRSGRQVVKFARRLLTGRREFGYAAVRSCFDGRRAKLTLGWLGRSNEDATQEEGEG
jgi:hypothetical protein